MIIGPDDMLTMASEGYTLSEAAHALGVSVSTVRRAEAHYRVKLLRRAPGDRGQGRKPHLSPEQVAEAERQIADGAKVGAVAEALGVSYMALYRARKRAAEQKTPPGIP